MTRIVTKDRLLFFLVFIRVIRGQFPGFLILFGNYGNLLMVAERDALEPGAIESKRRSSQPWPIRGVRLALIVVGLAAWFWSQSLIGSRPVPEGRIRDVLHELTAGGNAFLNEPAHRQWRNGLLIASSAGIDLLGIFLLGWSIFGPTIRPFVGLAILFTLRQTFQILCALPAPEGIIWTDPGFPSFLVTYGVTNDLYFSGHTSIAVYGAVELSRLGKNWLKVAAIALAVFEMVAVIVLRAHYTMDVYTGAVTALLVAGFAYRLAPYCDRAVARAVGGQAAGA